MSYRGEPQGTTTVNCVNADQCGGAVQFELFKNANEISLYEVVKSCNCEYSEDDNTRFAERVKRTTEV